MLRFTLNIACFSRRTTGPRPRIRLFLSLVNSSSYLLTYKVDTYKYSGAPALWTAPTLPVTIPKDDGKALINQNFDRVMAPSFAPFFAALLTMQPSYSLLPISLVTDRNSLRKLLDFASGRPGGNWRIEVELIEETLFLTRWEKNPVRIITGSFHSGHGHEFENAFLKFEEGLEESSSHHRIEEYEIGGMKWVVRFEADGYFEEDRGSEGSTIVRDSQPRLEMSAAMKAVSLESDPMPRMLEGVAVIQKGHLVSPESILEVKCVGKMVANLERRHHNAGSRKRNKFLLDTTRMDLWRKSQGPRCQVDLKTGRRLIRMS
jgi:hypothetical protein